MMMRREWNDGREEERSDEGRKDSDEGGRE